MNKFLLGIHRKITLFLIHFEEKIIEKSQKNLIQYMEEFKKYHGNDYFKKNMKKYCKDCKIELSEISEKFGDSKGNFACGECIEKYIDLVEGE